LDRPKVRYNIITIFVYAIGIILLLTLFNLQIVHGEEYRERSNTRLTRETTLQAARGNILDRTGNVIAGVKMGFVLDMYKTGIDNETLNNTILNLANILEKNGDTYVDSYPEEKFSELKSKYKINIEDDNDAKKIIRVRYEIEKIGYSMSRPIRISTDIKRETAVEISEKTEILPGITVIVEPIRNYEMGKLASHIVGYIGRINEEELAEREDKGYSGNSDIGKTGIESVFEEHLKGTNGIKLIDMDVNGAITSEEVSEEAIAGDDIVLTIDYHVQAMAEKALQENIEKIAGGGFSTIHDAKSGAAVVMNVKTGEILAMASYPDFNPALFVKGISEEDWNALNSSEETPMFNRAIQSAFAPASTFKLLTGIAGLESNAITINEQLYDAGVYDKAHKPLCWYYSGYGLAHGWQNVSEAIKNSCNCFFYEVGYRMGIDTLDKYALYFGLGRRTGVELLGETKGILASRETAREYGNDWYEADTVSAAIGQSYNSFSPIQLAKYISMLTNGGKVINPTIIKTIIKSDGTEVEKKEIEQFVNKKLDRNLEYEELSIKQENLDAILEGMREVTSDTGGTAYYVFKDFPIAVGGKTGSAEAGDHINGWFAGFAPYDNPEIAVIIFVENAGKSLYTAEAGLNIFREYFGMTETNIEETINATTYTETWR